MSTEPSGLRLVGSLSLIAVICGLLIVGAWQLTLPAIARNRAAAVRTAALEVLPGAVQLRAFGPDGSKLDPAIPTPDRLLAGLDAQGRLVGAAVEAQGQGFADAIKIIYGYDPRAQKTTGFKVLESKETPGLGDKIEKDSAFLAQCSGLDVTQLPEGGLRNAIVITKPGARQSPWQIDGITGATISSKAIGRILQESATQRLPAVRRTLLEAGAYE